MVVRVCEENYSRTLGVAKAVSNGLLTEAVG